MEIANEVNLFNVNLRDSNEVNDASGKILKRLRNKQNLLHLAQRKSIMTMASPGVYTYPLIMSGGIDTSQQYEIAKAFQITFASTVATAYSLNGTMHRNETPQVSDFVKKFHQNDAKLTNANLNAVAAGLGVNESTMTISDIEGTDFEVESATVLENAISIQDSFLLDMIAWERTTDGLVMESLNDSYRPYDRTARILKDRLQAVKESKIAMEKDDGFFDKLDGFAQAVNQVGGVGTKKNNASAVVLDTNRDFMDKSTTTTVTTKDGKKVVTKKNNVKKTSKDKIFTPNTFNSVKSLGIKTKDMTNMEPTVVNVQVVAVGKKDVNGGGKPSVHNVSLLVKAMPRIVNSSVMIASMVEAVQNSNAIFKFLKWTKGEINTLDRVLGITASKKKAIQKNAKNEVKYLEQSKKRRKKGLLGRFIRNEVMPISTVIITAFETEKIKEATGVDLNRYEMAAKLMNKYYLLGFCIYDTEQETMKVLFDSDSDWGTTSFSSMSAAVNNVKDVLNQNETLRLFGRK